MAPLNVCTISSREFLPFVRVMAASMREHQPNTTLWVLLAYDPDREIDASNEPFTPLWNDEIGFDTEELHRMYLIHGPKFMPAVKPFLLRHLVERTGGPVLYLDSDIYLYGSIDDLGEMIEHEGALVSPHARAPYPLDGLLPDDTTILSAGTFNAGVLGAGPKGLALMEFLISRLRRECKIAVDEMRVNEQRWLDLLPSYGPCHILRDPGVNAAYWNLHERPLRRVGGRILAGDAPLRAFHFSGYSPAQPDTLTTYVRDRGRILLSDHPVVHDLCDAYGAQLLAEGWEPVELSRAFPTLPGGIPVDETLREVYRTAVIACEAQSIPLPPDGYDLAQRELFLKWCRLTYAAIGLAVPGWAGGSTPTPTPTPAAAPAPPAPPPAVVAPATGVEPRVEATGSESGELVQRLARSTSAALANINDRVAKLELEIGRLTAMSDDAAPVGARS